jgi:hypothetical protein
LNPFIFGKWLKNSTFFASDKVAPGAIVLRAIVLGSTLLRTDSCCTAK